MLQPRNLATSLSSRLFCRSLLTLTRPRSHFLPLPFGASYSNSNAQQTSLSVFPLAYCFISYFPSPSPPSSHCLLSCTKFLVSQFFSPHSTGYLSYWTFVLWWGWSVGQISTFPRRFILCNFIISLSDKTRYHLSLRLRRSGSLWTTAIWH